MKAYYCTNGAAQVREMCDRCGGNARGSGINVPHYELHDMGLTIDKLPVLKDNRQDNGADEQSLLF